jgi:hypothetical protein
VTGVDHAAVLFVLTGPNRCYGGIVASFSDFSIWCNACDSYITHPSLSYVKKALELSKFADE